MVAKKKKLSFCKSKDCKYTSFGNFCGAKSKIINPSIREVKNRSLSNEWQNFFSPLVIALVAIL